MLFQGFVNAAGGDRGGGGGWGVVPLCVLFLRSSKVVKLPNSNTAFAFLLSPRLKFFVMYFGRANRPVFALKTDCSISIRTESSKALLNILYKDVRPCLVFFFQFIQLVFKLIYRRQINFQFFW